MNLTVVKAASCTFCGCVCDDIELHADADRIVRARNACPLGLAWFLHHPGSRGHPDALVDGKPASVDEAIAVAADLLRGASWPLVYGLGNLTCEAQWQALALAEELGGVIDSHTSLSHGPTEIGAQLVGKVSCTLGEVRNRADFVLYWGANPAESHPRHLTRYTLFPRGKFVPDGRRGRTLAVVDVRETRTARLADVFVQVRPHADFEVLTALRALAKGQPVDDAALAATGVSGDQLRDLLARMKRARFGVLFAGMGLPMTRGRHLNTAALYRLAAELNAFTKFAVMPMRGHGNVTGSDVTLRMTTGYPWAVDLSRGWPRSCPGEHTAVDLLARGEVDAALVLGADPAATMPRRCIDELARVPTVVLDPKVTHTSRLARVHITTAATGIATAGTAYRMDEVPIPLRPALRSPHPSDEEVVRRIRERIAAGA